MSVTSQVWKELAGPHYGELILSKKAALAHLFSADRNVRIASIHICDQVWECSSDTEFVNACQRIAATDADDSVRVHAIEAFGRAFQSSQDPAASEFLAGIVRNRNSSEEVRKTAYWALREVQMGLSEEDTVKRTISLMKVAIRKLPMGVTETQVKQLLLCGGRFPESTWDSADQIDWGFVNRFGEERTAM